ncbi:unnamed protein product [Nippostrongylus brasiliensis]|uniref:Recep_L_domain domain-containing protein n=1 Tax=Nippostrongylus brasiliensis TaxID=27835 RepID=A0A0N4YJ69_NIPBR|nr:unnamed protein product [Nippostrongylus brasiliensis]
MFSTTEIEEQNVSIPILGSSIYTRSVYTIVADNITVIDEQTIVSPLGNLDNCTLSTGSCILDDAVVIWKPISIQPTCNLQKLDTFDALVTLRYVLIPEYELTFEFNPDFFQTYQRIRLCNISQGYLSTSNHVLAFPNIPTSVMLHDFLIQNGNTRQRRDVKTITLADNRTSEFDLISKQPRLIPQLFHSEDMHSTLIRSQISGFSTRSNNGM